MTVGTYEAKPDDFEMRGSAFYVNPDAFTDDLVENWWVVKRTVDACGKTGGGTVFVPTGTQQAPDDQPLQLPFGVGLHGTHIIR